MSFKFRFNHLAPLCKSIRYNRKSIEQFNFNFNDICFDCIIDIDADPFEMIVGVLRLNFAFTLKIEPGYVTEISYPDYSKLCEILNLKPTGGFSSFQFLKYIDEHIPQISSSRLVPIEKILPYRINQMSNADRKEGFVFCGWLPHKGKNNGHVTSENLTKTKKLLGTSAEIYCKNNDISTKWTTDETQKVPLTFPWN